MCAPILRALRTSAESRLTTVRGSSVRLTSTAIAVIVPFGPWRVIWASAGAALRSSVSSACSWTVHAFFTLNVKSAKEETRRATAAPVAGQAPELVPVICQRFG